MTLRVLLFAIVTFFATSQSFSHSGGTDAYGCHTNHKTGHYHCHTPKATNEIKQNQSRQPSSTESQFESPKQYCCKICKKGRHAMIPAYLEVSHARKELDVLVMGSIAFINRIKARRTIPGP